MEIKKAPIWKWGVFVVFIIFLILTLIGIIGSFFSSPYKERKGPKQEISTTQQQSRASRTLSATFKLSADGTIVSCDINGKELHFKEGGWIRLEQLGQTGKYVWINHKIPSWSTTEKSCKTGPHTGNGIVELMSCSGREMLIKATIL